ncbi:glycosyltransferase family 2 protein [Streptomyces sp. NPDC047072]|uniref:glycosyltransferase family 2 protein n=1 Tax=Streptomyces sp. NPDC047072 TaxID=3154809 RepID=UPI0033D958B2
MQPALSVIIPFCNVERYLAACLDSVMKQTFADLEVVLVDDGSTDQSREIAQDYVGKDPRFRLLRQENRGPGAARNRGLREVSGRYLAFVDSDDLLAEDTYDQLVGVLRRTGSDLACGGVHRFNRDRSWPSPLHAGIFDEPRERTHITERRELLGDRTVWNKVYRRSFWERHEFRYPEHVFEDAFVTVPAHVLATAVDVVTGPVYFWRQRDDGPPSITQRSLDADIISGRMKQVRMVSGFLAARDPALKRAYDLAALEHDVLILLTALPEADEVRRTDILAFARAFVAGVDEETFAELAGDDAECYRLLRGGRPDDLVRHLRSRPAAEFL